MSALSESMQRWVEAWLPSHHVKRWLESALWERLPYHDLRSDWDEEDRWMWLIPLFDEGRTAVIGVEGDVLRSRKSEEIQAAFEGTDWKVRIKSEDLLLREEADSSLQIVNWEPPIEDVWHPDPRGGHFVTYLSSPRGLNPSEVFLALDGETWSAMGPKGTTPPHGYSLDQLKPYLPG